ncbi:hypothetical protein PUN28_016871 [Cardiocondyla obscurior]|uniref:Uncharacterized protein n=1 Tax=Cardiocondyla obscurior TaxID=286306 RepID=A0AAW2ESU1_9HYME
MTMTTTTTTTTATTTTTTVAITTITNVRVLEQFNGHFLRVHYRRLSGKLTRGIIKSYQ